MFGADVDPLAVRAFAVFTGGGAAVVPALRVGAAVGAGPLVDLHRHRRARGFDGVELVEEADVAGAVPRVGVDDLHGAAAAAVDVLVPGDLLVGGDLVAEFGDELGEFLGRAGRDDGGGLGQFGSPRWRAMVTGR
ncbi:hypothetical protein [Actinomadura madurae]|uniref:hypothetical protein n=1 Tax=Actinomadura madurae TaxID=1993 RepID=UPI0020D1FD4F|nr:hypothetical protein [Actinomadura madurae]MCQ0012670.1 hypothetical protein [Actinomadura madurae]